MTESRIDDLLDEQVPPFEPRPDGWEDVLARAHTTRRRYAALAVVALALLLVPTAVALRGQIADLFQGTPAPPAVSTSFESSNKIADLATQKGFGARFPHADVSKAHGVIQIQTPTAHRSFGRRRTTRVACAGSSTSLTIRQRTA